MGANKAQHSLINKSTKQATLTKSTTMFIQRILCLTILAPLVRSMYQDQRRDPHPSYAGDQRSDVVEAGRPQRKGKPGMPTLRFRPICYVDDTEHRPGARTFTRNENREPTEFPDCRPCDGKGRTRGLLWG